MTADLDLKKKMQAIMDNILREILSVAAKSRRRPSLLWHYTRPEAFLKILHFQSLRASHIRFMNDSMEYAHAINLALEAIKATRARNVISRAFRIQSAFQRNLEMALDLPTSNVVFAASLSGKRDDLSQWRAYGGPEGGVSIGFDFARLLGLETRPGSRNWLLPVEYSEVRQKKFARRIITQGVKLYDQTCNALGKEVDARVFAFEYMREATLIAAIMKHHAFRAENEWRLVTILDPPDPRSVEYFAKETLIVPAFDFDLKHPAIGNRMPVAEIVIGPGRMAEHSAAAARGLLLKAGYPVNPYAMSSQAINVSTSGIPYRVVN